MADAKYEVVFSGELKAGADAFAVRARIQEMFKLSDQAANQLFSGKTISIKKDLDLARATKFRNAFLQAGAIVQLVEQTTGLSSAPHKAERPASAEPGRMQHAAAAEPENRGRGLTLAPVDSGPLEAEPEAPSQAIGTGNLSLVKGENWSLEDVASTPPPVAVPDISHLSLVEMEPEKEKDEDRDPFS